jgi:hypothetical protein
MYIPYPLSLQGNGSVKIPLYLLGNGSVKVPLSLLGNDSVETAVTNTHAAIEELLDTTTGSDRNTVQ